MDFRSAGIIATLLIGLEGPGCQAFAQYYPPQIYPPPRAYPAPLERFPAKLNRGFPIVRE